ncbi:uncharacterized protein LOC135352063 isoform X3 [Halichondria panicea]|uniref:uncharacterized protein LOC135352063 isoform X3 n=1 Tax=Halichondria panicea TaxID=6063 RepID=UPI00312B5F5D
MLWRCRHASIPVCKNEKASNAIDRESDFLKSFQHPNVVQFLSTAKHPKLGSTILVVELMDCNLGSYFSGLDEESLTSECEISLSKDMACGLAYIHSKQIIHRDLCGDNVLLKLKQPLPVAKISDFGMSRLYDPSKLSHSLTAVSHRIGYLPLEVIRLEEEKYDNSVDVFSLGVIMVQIVCKLKTIKSPKDRSFHVSQIPHTHRLKKLIDSCLQEDMRRRPSARDISSQVSSHQLIIEKTKLTRKIQEYNRKTTPVHHIHLRSSHNDPSLIEYQGFVRVHMCVQRPIHVSMAITRASWYRLMRPVKERTTNSVDGMSDGFETTFYLPTDTNKVVHIINTTTTKELVSILLKKFCVTDNPKKFSLHEEYGSDCRRLFEEDHPLEIMLDGSCAHRNSKLVLRDNTYSTSASSPVPSHTHQNGTKSTADMDDSSLASKIRDTLRISRPKKKGTKGKGLAYSIAPVEINMNASSKWQDPFETSCSEGTDAKASQDHNFKPVSISHNKPEYCDVCGEIAWGLYRQVLKCASCEFIVHCKCETKVTVTCSHAVLSHDKQVKDIEIIAATEKQQQAEEKKESTPPLQLVVLRNHSSQHSTSDNTHTESGSSNTSNSTSSTSSSQVSSYQLIIEKTKLTRKIREYNRKTTPVHHIHLRSSHNDPSLIEYQGFVRVHMCLQRLIHVSTAVTRASWYRYMRPVKERTTNSVDGMSDGFEIAFYLPTDTNRLVHIINTTTTKELVNILLKKFYVTDNRKKFSLYEEYGSDCRLLFEEDHPLEIMLDGSCAHRNSKLVLRDKTFSWDVFALPELTNFIRILHQQEEIYINKLKARFAAWKQCICHAQKEACMEDITKQTRQNIASSSNTTDMENSDGTTSSTRKKSSTKSLNGRSSSPGRSVSGPGRSSSPNRSPLPKKSSMSSSRSTSSPVPSHTHQNGTKSTADMDDSSLASKIRDTLRISRPKKKGTKGKGLAYSIAPVEINMNASSKCQDPFETSCSEGTDAKASQDHNFKPVSIPHNKPEYCDVCGEIAWGLYRQVLKCASCEFIVHRKCETKVTVTCSHAVLSHDKQVEDIEIIAAPEKGLQALYLKWFFCNLLYLPKTSK